MTGSLLTFTSGPLRADVHVLGFPVVTIRLATSGTDGAVYVTSKPSIRVAMSAT